MNHPIDQRLEHTVRRRRLLQLGIGVLCLAAIAVAACVSLGLGDLIVGLDSPIARFLLSVAFWSILGVSGLVLIVGPLVRRYRKTELAAMVAPSLPTVGDDLVSATAFLSDSKGQQWGSSALRVALIDDVTRQIDLFEWSRLLPRRELRRAALLFALMVVIAALFALTAPRHSKVALARVLNPLSEHQWPRKHYLKFESVPESVVSGSDIALQVIDERGVPPSEVMLRVRYRQGDDWSYESRRMLPRGDEFHLKLSSVTRPFDYRATGGDDTDMEWRSLQVIEPPRVRAIEVNVHPPDYAGLPARSIQQYDKLLLGSGIAVRGEASEMLSHVQVVHENSAKPLVEGHIEDREFEISAEAFKPKGSGTYHIQLVNEQGIVGTARSLRLNVEPDPPPTVLFKTPDEDLFVMPGARIPFEVQVRDNLEVVDVGLATTGAIARTIAMQRAQPVSATAAEGWPQEFRYDWPLAPHRLPVGAVIEVNAVAQDLAGKRGRTPDRRVLRIVGLAEFNQRIDHKQATLVDELRRLLERQETLLGRAVQTEERIKEDEIVSLRTVDEMRALLASQMEVLDRFRGTDSVASHWVELLQEFKINGLGGSDRARRVQDIRSVLQGPIENALARVESKATLLKDILPRPGDKSEIVADPLAATTQAQQELVQQLASWIDDFAGSVGFEKIISEIERIKEQEQKLQAAVAKRLQESVAEIDSRQRQFLDDLIDLQQTLTRDFETVTAKIEQQSLDLNESDPLSAITLYNALAAINRLEIASQMYRIEGHLEAVQLGDSLAQLEKVDGSLADVLGRLRGQDQPSTQQRVVRLEQVAQSLEEIENQLEELGQKYKRHNEHPSELDQQNRDAAIELELLAGKLQQAGLNQASAHLRVAAERLRQNANRSAEQGEIKANRVSQAQDDLRRAAEEVSDALLQGQAQAVQDEVSKLLESAARFAEVQQQIYDQTVDSQEQRGEAPFPSRAWLSRVAELAVTQQRLRQQITKVVSEFESLAVLQGVMQEVADDMEIAEQGLASQRADDLVQAAQRRALERLRLLGQVWDDEISNSQGGEGEQSSDASPGGPASSQENAELTRINVAEARVVYSLQERLRDQVVQRESATTDEQSARLNELADQQAWIASLLPRLTADAGDLSEAHRQSDAQQKPQDEIPGIPDLPDLPAADGSDEEFGTPSGASGDSSENTGGKLAPPESVNLNLPPPLQDIHQAMKRAQLILREEDRSGAAGRSQQEVMAAFDKLFEMLRQQSAQKASSQSQGNQESVRSDVDPPQQAENTQNNQTTGEPQASRGPETTQRSPPEEASESMRHVLEQVWGHLPDRAREQVHQSGAEQFLPKYRKQLEEYYRRLAREED